MSLDSIGFDNSMEVSHNYARVGMRAHTHTHTLFVLGIYVVQHYTNHVISRAYEVKSHDEGYQIRTGTEHTVLLTIV